MMNLLGFIRSVILALALTILGGLEVSILILWINSLSLAGFFAPAK